MHRRVVALGISLLVVIGGACSTFSEDDDGHAPTSDAGADSAPPIVTDATTSEDAPDACPSTSCTPELFVGNQGKIVAMEADQDTLYWAVSGSTGLIMRRSFDGKTAARAFVGTMNAGAIAVDDADIYWTDFVVLRRTAKDGDGSLAQALDSIAQTAVVVDKTDIYWSNGMGYVYKLARAGGNANTVVTSSTPNALALDDAYLYVASAGTGLEAYPKGPPLGGPLRVDSVAKPVDQYRRVVAAGGFVFYLSGANVQSVAIRSGNVPYTITTSGRAISEDTDGTSVFWTEDDVDAGAATGVVRRAAPDGTGVVEVATAQSHPSLVVSGGDHVYWVVTSAEGVSTIMRRPK